MTVAEVASIALGVALGFTIALGTYACWIAWRCCHHG
jgi:hypothetical protein